MTPDTALHEITEAMVLVMLLSLPPILVASLVGVGSPWAVVLASGKPDIPGGVGASPTFLKGGGFRAISQHWMGISTYSGMHWSDHHRLFFLPGTTPWTMTKSRALIAPRARPWTSAPGRPSP